MGGGIYRKMGSKEEWGGRGREWGWTEGMGIDKEEWGGRGREWGWTEGIGWEGVEWG